MMESSPLLRPKSRDEFEIAIICALPVAWNAVEALFEVDYESSGISYRKAEGDSNSYTTGRLGNQHVVLAYMPGMSVMSAAAVACNLRSSFRNIKVGMVVGVCSGVPMTSAGEEILLGDVIVSTSVIHMDFGRLYPHRFSRKKETADTLGRAGPEIRAFIGKMSGYLTSSRLRAKTNSYSSELCSRKEFSNSTYPGSGNELIDHDRLQQIHSGRIASGNHVVKTWQERDQIAREEGVIGFEVESAGTWDYIPTIVIKGVCDYADGHNDKHWQAYAATTAAACTRAMLEEWRGTDRAV